MPLVIADRVRETTTTTGTGTITLDGAVTGFQSFSAVGNANTTYYVIADQYGPNWEVGIGTYTSSGATLSRDTVLASSNSGSLVNFGAGTKDVFGTYPAKQSIYADASDAVQLSRNSTNYVQAAGAAANLEPVISAQGSDSNISIALRSKGTGGVDLAAGSTGVSISNGTTVTAITRSSVGSGYTTAPTMTISAPTTPGGVQATATPAFNYQTATVVAGGTGYTVGDTLSVSGGTGTQTATITVATVSSGVITSVTGGPAFGIYTVLPSNPVSVTGGTGSGATFNLSWGLSAQFTITNAGSGYVEQPTITFSGGGGSGAAAYATVGSTPVVRSLGSSMSFYTSGGEGLRIQDVTNGALANYFRLSGGAAGTGPYILSQGSDANVPSTFGSKGTGGVFFTTNSGQVQLSVSHTASAVNYVQVTGAATGTRPTISVQGSDANVGLTYNAKGGANHLFQTSNLTSFAITNVTNQANYLQVTPAAASSAPSMSSQGSDSNIDLILTPKGTGVIQFGTHTGTTDTAISGYITIKDSGGTTRKLAVIT